MSRFRNDSGQVLTVNDLSRTVGINEEFNWAGHDPDVHGLIPGCTWLDAPEKKPAGKDSSGGAPAEDTKTASGRQAKSGKDGGQ